MSEWRARRRALIMATATENSADLSHAFIEKARQLIAQEYLPKIESCVARLTDQQIWWRPNPESNSIGNLLLHLCGNARQWIVCGLGNEPDDRRRQAEFDTQDAAPREQLLRTLRTTMAEVDGVLSSFDVSKLLNHYRIQGFDTTALDAIFHVTEHFSMHTGQIILITKQLTATDLRFYEL
ncbi:MAG TPA: DinB family protein [Pyrinomonadaceae bacterium]|jgi:uncharacterized damage-inducible protein DinB